MKLRKGLITTLFIATIMLFSGYIFVTTAFFSDSDSEENIFITSNVDIDIEEEFEKTDKENEFIKHIKIKNESSTEALVRVNITKSFTDNDGNIYGIDENMVELKFADNFQENWLDGGDGYYYYKKILGSNELTEPLLEKVILNIPEDMKQELEDKEFQVNVQSEAVQVNKYKIEDGKYEYSFTKVWRQISEEVINMLKELIDTKSNEGGGV